MIGVPIQSAVTATMAYQGRKWVEVRLRWCTPVGETMMLPGASRSMVTRNHPIHRATTPTMTASTPPKTVADRATATVTTTATSSIITRIAVSQ
jgi:hypothetical protein